jgi:hypothetical protein
MSRNGWRAPHPERPTAEAKSAVILDILEDAERWSAAEPVP